MPGGSPNASFRYDGQWERVAQQTTTSGVTTTTRYLLGGLEELTTVGSSSTLTKYYSVPGVVTAVKVGTTLSYLATDGLGSVSVALNASGSTTGQALYLPYGAGRYSSGSLPTARGYTGQYQDATSGLDYYGARYYDPVLGQFASADSVLAGGLNRYAYVGDNPTSATDPSGHHASECDASSETGPCGGDLPGPAGGGSGPDVGSNVGNGEGGTVTCDAACIQAELEAEYPALDAGVTASALDDATALTNLDSGLDSAGETANEAAQLHTDLLESETETAADENAAREAAKLHAQQPSSTSTSGDGSNDGNSGNGGNGGDGGGNGTPSGGGNGGNPGSGGSGGSSSGSGGSSGSVPAGYPTAYPPDFGDPTQPPGQDWQWKSSKPGAPGTVPGNWYNPETGEKWNPDLVGTQHGPHWDYAIDGIDQEWRWFPDGHFEPKYRW